MEIQKQLFVMQMVILQSIHRWLEVRHGGRPCMHFLLPLEQTCDGRPSGQVGLDALRGGCIRCHGNLGGMLYPKPERLMDRNSLPGGGSERIYRMFSLANRTEQGGKRFASVQGFRDTRLKKSRRNQILTLVGDKETACDRGKTSYV